MRILQAGAAKSGNFWLYKILDNIFKASGIPKRSFVKNQPEYQLIKNRQLSYPEQVSIDMLDIENRNCYWRISSIVREPVHNFENYLNSVSHVWTHSRICDRSLNVYPQFDKVVYIIRDPRDRILSEAKFAFSDYMRKHFPSGENSPEEFLENNFIKSMDRWRWHIYDHLRYSKELNIHIVFYERLLKDFTAEFDRLLDYLELDLSSDVRQEIRSAVQFTNMKKENSQHLNKKHYGTWEKVLSNDQKKLAEDINEYLLHMLQYPNSRFVPGILPKVPEELSKEYVESYLNKIGKHYSQASQELV